jgi:hypothetical protein
VLPPFFPVKRENTVYSRGINDLLCNRRFRNAYEDLQKGTSNDLIFPSSLGLARPFRDQFFTPKSHFRSFCLPTSPLLPAFTLPARILHAPAPASDTPNSPIAPYCTSNFSYPSKTPPDSSLSSAIPHHVNEPSSLQKYVPPDNAPSTSTDYSIAVPPLVIFFSQSYDCGSDSAAVCKEPSTIEPPFGTERHRFSKTLQMHKIVVGLVINVCYFGYKYLSIILGHYRQSTVGWVCPTLGGVGWFPPVDIGLPPHRKP